MEAGSRHANAVSAAANARTRLWRMNGHRRLMHGVRCGPAWSWLKQTT